MVVGCDWAVCRLTRLGNHLPFPYRPPHTHNRCEALTKLVYFGPRVVWVKVEEGWGGGMLVRGGGKD